MGKINNQNISSSKAGILFEKQNSENLLVSFGGIHQGLGIPLFEFFNSLNELNFDKLFLRDFNQSWYQKGIDKKTNDANSVITLLQKIIRDGDYKKVTFLGNSMGGYAAILFGTILNIDTVIAFSPQTFINQLHRFFYRDFRWKKQINSIHHYNKKYPRYFNLKKHLENTAYQTKISIYFATDEKLDKVHAERIKKIKNVFLFPHAEGGHSVVKKIRDSGELLKIIRQSFDN